MKKKALSVKEMIKRMQQENVILRCIFKFKNGLHKHWRVTVDKVATLCVAFRQLKSVSLIQASYVEMFEQMEIDEPYLIDSIKIIDERTQQEFLTLT